jgi:hypothetical protein
MSTFVDRIVEATRIRPGDTLVVRVHRNCTSEEIAELRRRLVGELPGLAAVVIMGGGIEQVAVLEGEAP